MTDLDLFNRFALVTAVAGGAGTAGLGLLLFGPRTWVGRAVTAGGAVAVMCGLTAVLAADVLGWVAGGGVAVAAACVLTGSAAVRQAVGRCVRPLARPRVTGVAALLAAFGVWGYEAWRYDAGNEALADSTIALAEMPSPPTKTVGHAQTDRGTAIDLLASAEPLSDQELAAIDQRSVVHTLYNERHITRGAPTDVSNCHGWVFAGGRYHVLGRAVDTILADNGYAAVAAPAAGDLCVYRGPQGEVTHTAIVRAGLPDGTVLVESKWGRMGVYLHDADESCYGTNFAYFRTARGTHLLAGIEGVSAVEAASEQP